ncbi:MAG: hypothetical protein ABGZ17_22065, partial [Planctomycetaceae bacterium]
LSQYMRDLSAQTAPAALLGQVLQEIGDSPFATDHVPEAETATSVDPPRRRQFAVLMVSLLATVAGLTIMVDLLSVRAPRPAAGQGQLLANRDQQPVAESSGSNALVADAGGGIVDSSVEIASGDGQSSHAKERSDQGPRADLDSVLHACRQADGGVVVIDVAVADVSSVMRAVAALKSTPVPSPAGAVTAQRPRTEGWSTGIYLQADPAEMASVLSTILANPTYRRMHVQGVVEVERLQQPELDLASRPANALDTAGSRPEPIAASSDQSVADKTTPVEKGGQVWKLKHIPVRLRNPRLRRAVDPSAVAQNPQKPALQPASPKATSRARQKGFGVARNLGGDRRAAAAIVPLRVVFVFRTPTGRSTSETHDAGSVR